MNQQAPTLQKLTMMNEDVWMHIGEELRGARSFGRQTRKADTPALPARLTRLSLAGARFARL